MYPTSFYELYVTVHGKRAHSPQILFFELCISRECTMRALRDDANCSKIAYSVLELYTEICELRKTHKFEISGLKLNYDLNANG